VKSPVLLSVFASVSLWVRLAVTLALSSAPVAGCGGDTGGTAGADNDAAVPEGCGDGVLDRGEECDDGNREAGDECSPSCRFEDACPTPWTQGQGTISSIAGSSLGSRAVTPLPTHYPTRYDGDPAPFPDFADIGWGQYPFATTDDAAPSSEELAGLAQLFEETTGKGVAIYNHPDDLIVGDDRTQIVLNLEYGASLATIAVPPGWDPEQSVPIVFSGNPGSSSNNKRLFQSGAYGAKYLLMPALAAQAGAPLIAVLQNTGGVASHGYHPRVMRDVGCVIDSVSEELGGDRSAVVFVGKSRGGGSALTWGANPLGLNYTTLGVFAHTPIWGNDYVMERPVSIAPVPAMLAARATYGESSFYESASPGRQEVVEGFLRWVSPLGTFASTAEHQVAAHVEGLVGVPAVSVCVATHDQELLSPDGVRMFEALEEAGVVHQSEVVIRGAHVDCPATTAGFEAQIRHVLGVDAEPPDLSKRVWSKEAALGESLNTQVIGIAEGLPTWGILPVAAEVGTTLEVHVCGAGGAVEVVGRFLELGQDPEQETELYRESLAVAERCEVFAVAAPASAGRVSWSVELPSGDAASAAIEPGRAFETQIFSEPLPFEAHLWSTEDTRVAGFAILPESP
jgi:cysteine-rich repeat protein